MLASEIGVDEISVRDFERLAGEFRDDLAAGGRSRATIRAYAWGFASLMKFAGPDGTIDSNLLLGWQDDLLQRVTPRSYALAGTGVRRLLHWAAAKGAIGYGLANAVPTASYSKGLPRTLTPADMLRIEYHLLTQPVASMKVRDLRDRALYFYVKATAGSVSEILQVRRDQFEHQVVRQRGGGNKTLTAPPGVASFIRDYLNARTDQLEWLWVGFNTDGSVTKLQEDGVLKCWERLAKKAGVRRFTTVQLRHTAGALLAQRGHDLTDIMAHLGARDIRTVQGYKEIAENRLARVQADLDVSY